MLTFVILSFNSHLSTIPFAKIACSLEYLMVLRTKKSWHSQASGLNQKLLLYSRWWCRWKRPASVVCLFGWFCLVRWYLYSVLCSAAACFDLCWPPLWKNMSSNFHSFDCFSFWAEMKYDDCGCAAFEWMVFQKRKLSHFKVFSTSDIKWWFQMNEWDQEQLVEEKLLRNKNNANELYLT